MHTTSYSLEIIKELQAGLTEGIMVLLLLSLISCKEFSKKSVIPKIEVAKDQLILHPEEGKWYYNSKEFSGYALTFHPDSTLSERIGYYKGKKEGLAHRWYPNHILKFEAYYKANRLVGKARVWSEESILLKEANYVDGYAHGTQRLWYKSGKPFKETHFNMGKEEGIQRAWLENGAVFANYEAKNGRFFGLKRANACYELKDEVIQF